MTDVTAPAKVLDRRTIFFHGCIGLPLAVIGYPLAIWIPAHYAGGLGLSLAAVGTILMLARFTDVISDPLMGPLADAIWPAQTLGVDWDPAHDAWSLQTLHSP